MRLVCLRVARPVKRPPPTRRVGEWGERNSGCCSSRATSSAKSASYSSSLISGASKGVVEVVVVLKKTHQSVHALADGVCGRASAQGAGVFAGFFPSFFRWALLHPLGELFGLVRTGLGSALAVLFAFDVGFGIACDKVQEGGLLRLGAGHGKGSFGVGLKLCGRGFACRGSIEKEAQKIQMSFSHDSGKQWGH